MNDMQLAHELDEWCGTSFLSKVGPWNLLACSACSSQSRTWQEEAWHPRHLARSTVLEPQPHCGKMPNTIIYSHGHLFDTPALKLSPSNSVVRCCCPGPSSLVPILNCLALINRCPDHKLVSTLPLARHHGNQMDT